MKATDAQIEALLSMAAGAERAEADRARAILLTLSGWTSPDIALAFCVREDTVRLWRSSFMAVGIGALKSRVSPGPVPVKAQAALRVAAPLLSQDVANRENWTLARLSREIQAQEGISISRSQLSKVLRKKGGSVSAGPRHTLKGRQNADEVDRIGLRLGLRRAQGEAGDIILLYGDESEALTHPYLAGSGPDAQRTCAFQHRGNPERWR